jgi:hypothetical protein
MPVDPNNNISGFIQNFAGGGVRTNLFLVSGVIPGYANARAISFLCKAAQIPASSLGVIEVPYRGRRIKLPGDRTFQDWTITVMSDANMSLRSAFEAWSTAFNSHVSNVGTTNFTNTDLMPMWSVTQLLRDGEPLRTYNFIGCFPSEVGAIDLSYENNDQIAEFPVTIQYSYWVAAQGGPGNNATGNGNLIGAIQQALGTNIGTGF